MVFQLKILHHKLDPADHWPSHTAPDTLLSEAKQHLLNTYL